MHTWLSDVMKHLFNTYARMTVGPYQNDICQVLDVNLKKKEEEAETPTVKVCPFCKSEIDIEATRCPHCTSHLEEVME